MEGSLSSTLKALRTATGLSQAEVARRAKLSQASITRFETAYRLPTAAQIRTLCRIYKAPPEVRRDLLEAVAAQSQGGTTTVHHQTGRPLSRGTAWRIQARIGRIEKAATLIQGFQPLLLPGLLQTEGYMRAVFGQRMTAGDQDRAVEERLKRQRQLRGDQFLRHIVSEAALGWMAGGPQVMAAQMGALLEAPGELGVIPQWTGPVSKFPVYGFNAYDNATVIVGILNVTMFMTGPADVAAHLAVWEDLAGLAAWGGEARRIIEAAGRRYRRA